MRSHHSQNFKHFLYFQYFNGIFPIIFRAQFSVFLRKNRGPELSLLVIASSPAQPDKYLALCVQMKSQKKVSYAPGVITLHTSNSFI